MLNKEQKNRLKIFISSPDYQIAQKIADSLITQIRSESTIKETEWDTIKETIIKEGQVSGIQRFLKELFSNAS